MNPRGSLEAAVALSLLSFEALVLETVLLFPYAPDPGLSTFHLAIYSLLAPASTVFLLGVLYTWLLDLGKQSIRHSRGFRSLVHFSLEYLSKPIFSIKSRLLLDGVDTIEILFRPKLMLGISLAVSVVLAFFPYRPDLNPTGSVVGIDSPTYVGWISQMTGIPPLQALKYSFVEGLDGSRPILLILLYLSSCAGAPPERVVAVLPVVLAPLLSFANYLFVRFGQGRAGLAGLTSLFTPVSFYVTVGLWGGYYANWLAMIFAYLFLTLLLMFSRAPSAGKYSSMLVLSVALLLTHPWTWLLISSACLVFAASIWRETGSLLHLKSMTGVAAIGIIIELVKSSVFATRNIAVDLASKIPTNVGFLVGFWNGAVDALLYTHGGLLGNWIVTGFALLGVLGLRFRNWSERLLLAWIGIASIPFFLLDSYHKARVVYDLPFPTLASLGTVLLFQLVGMKNVRWLGVCIAIVLALMAVYALQGILLL